jgi:hypothetical protein
LTARRTFCIPAIIGGADGGQDADRGSRLALHAALDLADRGAGHQCVRRSGRKDARLSLSRSGARRRDAHRAEGPEGRDRGQGAAGQVQAGRTAPKASLSKDKKTNEFSAIFQTDEPAVYVFTLSGLPNGKTFTEQITVTASTRKTYRTIADVLDDPKAVRRRAMLASIARYFPAFNTFKTGDDNVVHAANFNIGDDTGIMNQGKWVHSFAFDGLGSGTSCTTVNPGVVGAPVAKNDSAHWAFDAGPEVKPGPNPGWTVADKDHIPNVGDVYILRNLAYGYGHTGFVLHVPQNGNGLWVTADGGQGKRPQQLAIFIPRWGLMGAMLPQGGNGKDSYPDLKPDDNGPPWLSGATGEVIHADAPVPQQENDVAGMIKRVRFMPTSDAAKPSNPRRIAGFVDVDSPKLKFETDGKQSPQDVIDACKLLQGKVNDVIASCLRGNLVGGAQT